MPFCSNLKPRKEEGLATLVGKEEYTGTEPELCERLISGLSRSWAILTDKQLPVAGLPPAALGFVVVGANKVFVLERRHWAGSLNLNDRSDFGIDPVEVLKRSTRQLAVQLKRQVPGLDDNVVVPFIHGLLVVDDSLELKCSDEEYRNNFVTIAACARRVMDDDARTGTFPGIAEYRAEIVEAIRALKNASSPTALVQSVTNTALAVAPPVTEDSAWSASIDEPPAVTPCLAPYAGWRLSQVVDPQGASDADLDESILEIVRLEGPVLCQRVYRLYCAAFGRQWGPFKRRLNSAVNRLLNRRLLQQSDDFQSPGQMNKIVRMTDTAEVVVRERGDRLLNEIPPSELGALMSAIIGPEGSNEDIDWDSVYSTVLETYGVDGDTPLEPHEVDAFFDRLDLAAQRFV